MPQIQQNTAVLEPETKPAGKAKEAKASEKPVRKVKIGTDAIYWGYNFPNAVPQLAKVVGRGARGINLMILQQGTWVFQNDCQWIDPRNTKPAGAAKVDPRVGNYSWLDEVDDEMLYV